MNKKKLLSVAILLSLALSGMAQALQLKLNNVTVKQAMTELKEKSGYSFVYEASDMNVNKKVNVDAKDLPQAISQIIEGQDVTYEIKGKSIVISRNATTQGQNTTQGTRVVTGVVRDMTGEPIIGATIKERQSSRGVVTDFDGRFQIEVSDNSMLDISYIGYDNQAVNVKGKSQINITMKESIQSLDELVVTAYGTQTRRNVTGSMQTVSFDDYKNIPVGQLTQKIQGQIAGVQVNQGTGVPGQGMNVKIRGAASLSTGASPLYVVDGFPIVGDINNINPNEIESMSILKDAAATALYGSRAAFGVVLITTKGAKAGKTSVDVDAFFGIQSVPQKGRPDMMNGTEWAQFRKENYEDLGQPVPDIYQNPSQYGEGYNWYDAMLRTAKIQNYNVTIKGGTDKFTTSVVLGYYNQDGVMQNSDYKRFSARANAMYKISPTLTARISLAPTFSYEHRPSTDGAFFSGGGLLANANLTPPIISWEDADGTLPANINTPGVTQVETPNWVRSIKDTKNERTIKRLLANASLEFTPIKDLLLKTSISTDLGSEFHTYFQPSTAGRAFAAAANSINAYLSDANNRYYSWLWENTATYSKTIGKHHFEILAGFTVQKFRSDYTGISGSNYADDRIQTINAALVKNNPSQDIQEWSMMSYLGRVNYDFMGRYLLSASIRRDGSSRFGIDNKWGNFPAASVGWLVNEENFMKSLSWLSLFKVRASYGLIGNNNIGNYTQYNVISNSNTVFGSTTSSGVRVTNLGNTDLGWERTAEFDFGIDLSFLNNRITFTYDYYNKTTKDLLYSLSVPRESGFSNYMGNVGKLRFWGHEFSIVSHNLTGAFKWDTNFNISFSDNKVLELSAMSDQLIAWTGIISTITEVGGRIGQFYGMVQEGVYKDQNDYDNSPKAVDSQVGTIKFRDINGDGQITYDDVDGDKTIIGNPFPDFIFGITNNFYYKNFDLSVIASGSVGNDIATPMEQGTTNLDGLFNVLADVKDRWRSPENPGSGKYGKTTSGTGRERDQFHSRYIKDGSYFAIKNITLGYTIPANTIKYVNSLRIYASVQNPFIFTSYPYGNPEVGVDFDGNSPSSLLQGIDYSTYPVPRTFTLGINLSF